MRETLNNKTYLEKKKNNNFFGTNVPAPKSAHRREKWPVLGQ